MSPDVSDRSPPRTAPAADKRSAGDRALANTLYRVAGEGSGRLASLVMFAFAGHRLGEAGLGAFVFATAFLGFVMVPVDLGLDRYLLRRAARRHADGDELFWDVLALKLALAVPLFALGIAALPPLGYSHQAQATVWALAPGVFCDSVARTQLAVFQAHERAGPPALADSVQRIVSAALGIAALLLGLGVVSIAASYSIGSALGVLLGFVLMARRVGVPRVAVAVAGWRSLMRHSLPYATQDVFVTILYRVDTVILSLIASQAAVGRYGAAYRLFESSMLVTYALVGAFAAMYTYLRPDGRPPLQTIFQRSIKLALVLLVPVSVAFVTLGGEICAVIFGAPFVAAGVPLGILGPGVVLIGVVTLATSLMISRADPRRVVALTAAMAAVNVVLNLILIPPYADAGAAAAMLATEAVFALLVMRMAMAEAGRLNWVVTAAGALAGGAAMVLATLLLRAELWVALTVGAVLYAVVLVAVESVVSPGDVRFAVGFVRRRLRARPAG